MSEEGESVLLILIIIVSLMSNPLIYCFEYQKYDDNLFALLDSHYNHNDITVLDYTQHKNNYISFIMDKQKNIFVIKQDRRVYSRWQLYAVREWLGAWVAELSKISAHRVRIIPAGIALPGKRDQNRPAALLTLAPGVRVGKVPRPSKVFIKQPQKEEVPKELWGLTRRVIHDMAVHSDLPKIVALDTFIGNDDRNSNNFFYDERTNRFTAIDLATSFHKDLSIFACNLISTLLQNHEQLSQQEIAGLIIYRDTLKKLAQLFPPYKLHKALDEFVKQSGIKRRDTAIWAQIKLYKKTMSESYQGVKRLVKLLDKLIVHYEYGNKKACICDVKLEQLEPSLTFLDVDIRIQAYHEAFENDEKEYEG